MSRHVTRRALVVAALAACGLGGTGSGRAAGADRKPVTHTVTIDATSYAPAALAVRAGDTIVWVNKDLFPHTVTAKGGAFDSDVLVQGSSWRYTPKRAGTFPYTCTFHPTMAGRLEVR